MSMTGTGQELAAVCEAQTLSEYSAGRHAIDMVLTNASGLYFMAVAL